MKTKILFVAVLVLSVTANAQTFKAGLNLANISITNDGDIDKNNMLAGFQVGFTGDVSLGSWLYLQPGLVFTGKGSKTQSGSTSDATYYRATSNPLYVEVPLNLVFKTPKAPVRFFAGAGPYLAMGVAGKNKSEGKIFGVAFSSSENIRWSDDDPSTLNYEEGAGYGIMKRFDYGLNGIAGIETDNIVLSGNFGYGMAKLQSGSNSQADDKNKHRVISFTVGFKL